VRLPQAGHPPVIKLKFFEFAEFNLIFLYMHHTHA
jgi:hypothetical protein